MWQGPWIGSLVIKLTKQRRPGQLTLVIVGRSDWRSLGQDRKASTTKDAKVQKETLAGGSARSTLKLA